MASIDEFDLEADEALWDEQFAKSKDVLRQMARRALEESVAGLTEPFEAFDIEADEALWDEQFAKSQDVLERLAREDYLAGRTEDCDDPDEV